MFAAEWNLRTSFVTCPVYSRPRVNTFRALDTGEESSHHIMLHQKLSWIMSTSNSCRFLSLTNTEPSFLKQSSLSFRASQNAFQQLFTSKGHAGCKKESNLPRREVTEFWKLRSRVIIASNSTATSREQTDHALKLATKTNVKRETLETVQKRKSLGGAI